MKLPEKDKPFDIEFLIALFAADIDIFLLKEEDQETDVEKDCFTKEEIRQKLKNTVAKFYQTLEKLGVDLNEQIKTKTHINKDSEIEVRACDTEEWYTNQLNSDAGCFDALMTQKFFKTRKCGACETCVYNDNKIKIKKS